MRMCYFTYFLNTAFKTRCIGTDIPYYSDDLFDNVDIINTHNDSNNSQIMNRMESIETSIVFSQKVKNRVNI